MDQNSDDKGFLEDFWSAMEQVAAAMGEAKQLRDRKCGILSQVAVFHALRSAGRNPTVPSGEEDAWFSADIIEKGATRADVVQVKGGASVQVMKVKTISFPAIHEKIDITESRYAANPNLLSAQFVVNLGKLSERIGRTVVGYLVFAPFDKIDGTTGVPSKEFLQAFSAALPRAEEWNV